mgnify:CR=1 FL=1
MSSVNSLKPGDRVFKEPMWKHERAEGVVLKISGDGYTIVKWDNINGDWYYTEEQAKTIKVIKPESKED